MLTVELTAPRGLNDDQLPAWLDYLPEPSLSLRFIELMRTGSNLAYFQKNRYRADSLERLFQEAGWTAVPRANDAGPAREYRHFVAATIAI